MSKSPAKITQEFMAVYKELESIVGYGNMAFYEQTLPNGDEQRLRICRQVRNILAHEPAGFILPSQAMIDFLAQIVRQKRRHGSTAIMLTGNTGKRYLSEGMSVREAASQFKRGIAVLPVVDRYGKYLGAVSRDTISAMVTAPQSKTGIRSCIEPRPAVPALFPGDKIQGWTAVVDDAGRYLGYVE